MSKFLKRLYVGGVVAGLTVATEVAAHAQSGGFTLPDTGVDIASGVTAVITKIGTVVLVAAGGALAFMAVAKGIKWARKAA